MDSVKDWGSRTWTSLSSIRVGGAAEDEETGTSSLLEQFNEATTMSRMQRLTGFGICFGIGIFFSLISQLFILSPRRFGVCYTLGNLLSLGSMMFLMGPWQQVKNMFNKGRWVATSIYLACLVGTLFSAVELQSSLLTLLFIALQFCALIWYSISYIPFARQFVMSIFTRCFGEE